MAQDPSYNDPEKQKSRKRRKSILNIVDWTLRLGAIAVILALLIVPFLPGGYLKAQQDAVLDYLMKGLEHYQEMPEYAIHDVDRFISIKGPGHPINYHIKVVKPYNFSLRLEDSGKEYPVQEVTYEIMADPGIKIVRNEQQVAAQGGKPCVIITEVPDPTDPGNKDKGLIMIHGYNLSDQTHNFKIKYKIKVTSVDWTLSPGIVGDLSDIDPKEKTKYFMRQWEVGDLNKDGDMDLVDEDEHLPNLAIGNAQLDFGEDVDGDGLLDVNEDLNGDGEWDYRIDPTNKVISDLANGLKGSETNVYKIVESFYDYLQDYFHYPNQNEMQYDAYMYPNGPKSDLRVNEDKYGDCDDQSILLISMCRAVGIPAWLECGALFDPTLKSWENHGWANVMIPLKGGGTALATIDAVNHQFLVRDANRFTEWIDTTGVPTDIEEYYKSFSYSYAKGGGSGGPTYDDHYQYVEYDAHPSDLKIRV